MYTYFAVETCHKSWVCCLQESLTARSRLSKVETQSYCVSQAKDCIDRKLLIKPITMTITSELFEEMF